MEDEDDPIPAPKYDNLFWSMTVAVAILLWALSVLSPNFAYLPANLILCIVLVGWLNATWARDKSGAQGEDHSAAANAQANLYWAIALGVGIVLWLTAQYSAPKALQAASDGLVCMIIVGWIASRSGFGKVFGLFMLGIAVFFWALSIQMHIAVHVVADVFLFVVLAGWINMAWSMQVERRSRLGVFWVMRKAVAETSSALHQKGTFKERLALAVSPTGYNHVFWAMALIVAMGLWSISILGPIVVHLNMDAIVAIVIVGWLNAIWHSEVPKSLLEEAVGAAPAIPSQLWSKVAEVASLKGHSNAVSSVAFSSKGDRLASGGYDSVVKLWNIDTAREERTIQGDSRNVFSVNFSPDNRKLAIGGADGRVKLITLEGGGEPLVLEGHHDKIRSVSFSPNGFLLATGSADRTIILWSTDSGRQIRVLRGHTDQIRAVAFSPDGKTIASASYDKTARIWETATGRQLAQLKGHSSAVYALAFSPDGALLATGSFDQSIRIWDSATGHSLASLSAHAERIESLAFSADGKMLASGSGAPSASASGKIKIWDLVTGQERLTLRGPGGDVSSLAFSPDGKTLAAGFCSIATPGEIKLWTEASAAPASAETATPKPARQSSETMKARSDSASR